MCGSRGRGVVDRLLPLEILNFLNLHRKFTKTCLGPLPLPNQNYLSDPPPPPTAQTGKK